MDSQFYRKVRKNLNVGVASKKLVSNKRLFASLLIAIPVCSFITFSNKGLLQRMTLETEKRSMQQKVQEAQREQQKLQQQSKALDADPRAIEKVAREKYGMIRGGETVYKVKKEK